jgi:hypothetical protein
LGLFFAEILTEGWNTMWPYMRVSPHYLDNSRFLTFVAAILVFTGLLAGGYPAFYISNFEPISILKGKMKFGGTNYFTRTLLGLQFAISLIAIISAIAFYKTQSTSASMTLGSMLKALLLPGWRVRKNLKPIAIHCKVILK